MKAISAAALAAAITITAGAQARPIQYIASPTIETYFNDRDRNYTSLRIWMDSATKEIERSSLGSSTCCTVIAPGLANWVSVGDVIDSYDQASLLYDTYQFRIEFIFGTEFGLLDRTKPYPDQAVNVPYEFQVIDKLNNFRSDWKTGELSGIASASMPSITELLAMGLAALVVLRHPRRLSK